MELLKNDYIPLNEINDKNYSRKKSKILDILKKLIVFSAIIFIIYISIRLTKNEKLDLEDFEFVNTKEKNGPITINRKKDDGTKQNIFSMINNDIENDSFFYDDEDKFQKLDNIVNITQKYLCEYHDKKPSESFEGYYLTCPTHYTISINNTFYGRYKGDLQHCITYPDGRNANMFELMVKETCGVQPLDTLKEICEDKKECLVRPCNAYFGSEVCLNTYKYLYVDYYCKKDIVCIFI